MKILKVYVEPEAEVIALRFEGALLSHSLNRDNNEKPDDDGEEDF